MSHLSLVLYSLQGRTGSLLLPVRSLNGLATENVMKITEGGNGVSTSMVTRLTCAREHTDKPRRYG